ncbi:hypothetical protein ALC53_00662 [Atta colombica]|uniref:Uncharacterized protein n=1 Tax=Atta colombica TaxID=520822 RepID=A0A195BWR5_9HYME|nr:hypothetical protein ALC53_00662 [Atta colombica]
MRACRSARVGGQFVIAGICRRLDGSHEFMRTASKPDGNLRFRSCSNERSFFYLRHLKSYLRSTMKQKCRAERPCERENLSINRSGFIKLKDDSVEPKYINFYYTKLWLTLYIYICIKFICKL